MADTFRVRSGTSLDWWEAAGNGWGLEGPGEGGSEEGELNAACVTSPAFLSTFPCTP